MGARDRDVARRIAETFRLLERAVVLLVHDDQTQTRQRREYGEPRPEHDARIARLCRAPVLHTLCLVQRAVQADEAGLREARLHHGFELRRQRDLGHQHQHLPAAFENGVREAKVNLGLAAAGDAHQEERSERIHPAAHGLGGRELRRRRSILGPWFVASANARSPWS